MDGALLPEGKWRDPGSLGFLALLLVGGALFAWGWTQLGYRDGNLERQGIDIVHHALILRQVNESEGINEHSLGVLADYPNTSHRLAAFTLPWFGDDAIVALRFSALTTVIWLLALQFTLLCRLLPWVQAALVLLLWQWLCTWGKVSNPNHFWEGMYNYSRAVGGLGLWWSLLMLTSEPSSAWRRRFCYVLATGGAAFALACHLVPGAVAFGGIMLYALAGWLRNRQTDRLLLLIMALLAAGGMYWGTDVWRHMVRNAGSDGWLPVGPLELLLMWVPLAGLAALVLVRPIFSRSSTEIAPARIPAEGLMTALLAAGGLQLLAFLRMTLWQTCAPYAVKSLFYYTFPLAALLGILWLALLSGRLSFLPAAQRWKVPHFLAAGLLLASLAMLYHQDRGLRTFVKLGEDSAATVRFHPPRDQLPHAVTKTLQGIAHDHQGWYYLDPNQPFGAFFASVAGLKLEWETAVFCREKLAAHDYSAVLSNPKVRGILLPAPAAGALPFGISGKPIGCFREYPVALVQRQ